MQAPIQVAHDHLAYFSTEQVNELVQHIVAPAGGHALSAVLQRVAWELLFALAEALRVAVQVPATPPPGSPKGGPPDPAHPDNA